MSERNNYWKDFYPQGDADEKGNKSGFGPLDWVKSRFRSEQNPPEALEKKEPEPPYVLRPGEMLVSESELDNEDFDDGLEERDYYPIRFRRDGRTGCLGGLMYAVFVISVSIILACVGWMAATDVLALNKPDHTATITIPKDVVKTTVNEEGKKVEVVDIDYVADQLKNSGIIEYKFLFKLFSRISKAAEKIDPGTYELSAQYDYRALVKKMQVGSGSQVGTTITFPEGYTMAQIFEKLEENDICPVEDLYEAAANYNYSYSFLEGMEPGEASRLEGYLFPDTY